MKKICDRLIEALREKPGRFRYVLIALVLGTVAVQTGLAGESLDQVLAYLVR